MEPRSQGKRAQGTLGFRSSKKLLQQPQRDGKKRHLASRLEVSAQQTWPPSNDIKAVDIKAEEEKLPERLMLLEELYNSMEAAISLLRIRRTMCTFSTIAAAVESSTQRRFLRSHLAQMKHILPEALQIEEHISWDAESQCSRRDLRLNLLPISNAEGGSLQRIKSPQKSTDMVLRRREFHKRLVAFHHRNKKIAVDVPEASVFGVASSCVSAHSIEPRKLSLKVFEDVQEKTEVCKTNKQVEASQPDSVEDVDTEQAGDLLPLQVAFDMSQLKKYPRSPSKLPHHRRISPVLVKATLSHLPPIFKPHFSTRQQANAECLVKDDSSEKAPDMLPTSESRAAIMPHFSLKKCTEGVVSSDPCTPQKMSIQTLSPEATLSSPPPAASTQVSLLMSPPAVSIATHELKCRTPAQSDCAVISSCCTSPVVTTLASTPQHAVFTPSAVITPSTCPQSKEAEAIPAKRNKLAVIKSLRFGTPAKHGVHEMPKCMNVKETTMAVSSEAFMSPVKTPTTDTFVIPKKSAGKVSRVLPFNSPGHTKNKVSPQAAAYEDKYTPKRRKLSAQLVSELKPSNIKEDFAEAGSICSPTDNAEVVASGDKAEYIELISADKLSTSDLEILKCLPQKLLNDVQEKEKQQLQDLQCGLEQARRRQQLVAGLPKLFNMVRLLFQSENRTVLTRKDLVKMVLSSHPDITDQGEIMEQLQLLVDFAPEWISSNRSSTGDLIYRINKKANMRAVSKGLIEAK